MSLPATNNMTRLLKKVSMKLGLIPLLPYLPKEYNMEGWADVIKEISLVTYNRYMNLSVSYKVNRFTPRKNGYYVIDEEKYFGVPDCVIGVQDIDWANFSSDNLGIVQAAYGCNLDAFGLNFGADDFMLMQMRANMMSFGNNSLYVECDPYAPSHFKIVSVTGANYQLQGDYMVKVLIKHPETLTTIEDTRMETFEDLVYADVSQYLMANLKYWERFVTAHASIELHTDSMQDFASKRDAIVDKLAAANVSAANGAIPFIISM